MLLFANILLHEALEVVHTNYHSCISWTVWVGVICISKNVTRDILTSSFQQANDLSLTLFISNLIFGSIHGDFVHKALLRFADGIAE